MHRQPVHGLVQIAKGFALVFQLCKAIGIVVFILPYATSARRASHIQRWCSQVLNILNVRVLTRGYLPIPTWSPSMFVANHISWLDILILTAVHRMYFVAKAEVREWPIIGWIAERTGTVFLERERGKSLAQVTRTLTHTLQAGQSVAMFPEGTTTDGTTLKPFHSGLFQAAVDAQTPVWPVTIRYGSHDMTIDRTPAFVGDQSLVRSLLKVVAKPALYAELHFGRPISSKDQSRWELVRGAEHAIASRLQLTVDSKPTKKLAKPSRTISSHEPHTVA